MQLYTFKARSLAEALGLVRDELGPDASVLHTREVGSPLVRLLGGGTIEVTASAELSAPSRLPPVESTDGQRLPGAELHNFRRQFRDDLLAANETEPSLVEQLAAHRSSSAPASFPGAGAIADRLRTAGVADETAARWLQRLEAELACDPECHPDRMLQRLRQIIASELSETILR
jgi:flagellar biosynthesis protein FlhF